MPGAFAKPNGAAIYKKQCVSCHGAHGEGVEGKGKYKDALEGDWSLEKLTRYIDKNMPDDHPERCKGPDAEAVARYIYDAFYSREARVRLHPPRVELVRLTNRQYLNSVADLVQHFTGNEALAVPSGEHGLAASYFNSRNFNGDKKLYDRTDPQVSFQFGTGGPEKNDTNEFSIKWRGSVIAEEAGTYEFIVKTEIGSRLWVNDEQNPVIDQWVASAGGVMEHKAFVRLLGGRAYPLRLECFRFKDKTSSMELRWKPPHGPEQVIPARNLLTQHAPTTFVVTVPFPADDSSVGYERGVSISKAWDEATTRAAIEVANHIIKQLDQLSKSKASDTNRTEKLESFCTDFVSTAFRRPLSPEQKQEYVTTQFKSAAKPEDAVKRVVLLALKSPRFLYLGLDNAKPDDFEVATRVSFALWDSLPDTALRKAAEASHLHNREQVQAQTERMLKDARAHAKIRYFFEQWTQMNRVEDLSKDPSSYPGFNTEIVGDLRASLTTFVEDTMWSGGSDYRKLLLADYLFVNDRLAKFYGLTVTSTNTNDFVKVQLDPKQRCGVLTHPYLLSEFAYAKASSPIHRGVFLTRNVIGRALKPPPMAVAFKDADFAPNLTMREKVTELTKAQACQSCHSVINPLGFSLEHYDAVGKYRASDNGRDIDAISEYVADDGKSVKLTGPRDIAEFAVNSEQAQSAFIEQLFHQLIKQPLRAYGANTIDQLRQSFAASDFNMQKLVGEIVATAAIYNVPQTESRKP